MISNPFIFTKKAIHTIKKKGEQNKFEEREREGLSSVRRRESHWSVGTGQRGTVAWTKRSKQS